MFDEYKVAKCSKRLPRLDLWIQMNFSSTDTFIEVKMNNDEKRITTNSNIGHNNNTSSIWTNYDIDNNEGGRTNTPAEIYEQHLVPVMFEPFVRDLIQLCDIRRYDRILDVACGTGIVSSLAIFSKFDCKNGQ